MFQSNWANEMKSKKNRNSMKIVAVFFVNDKLKWNYEKIQQKCNKKIGYLNMWNFREKNAIRMQWNNQ